MSIPKYVHCDNEDEFLTLHDCCVQSAFFQDGILILNFNDGFWISPKHPSSTLQKTVRTDQSKVEFILENHDENDITIYVFSKSFFGKTIRDEWSIDKLIAEINSGNCELEILYQYKDYHERIIECTLRFHKKPYYKDCLIKMSVSKVSYYWNNFCTDKPW